MADEMLTGFLAGQADGNNGGNGGGFFGNEGIWAVIILAIIFGWGWGGNNGFGGGAAGGQGGVDTRAAISDGFALNGLENGVRGIQQGLCDGFYAMNTSLMSGFNGVNTAMLQGFNGVQSQMANLSAQNQACCCETQRIMERGFADTNYNLATQECQTRQAVTDAGRAAVEASNANTRAILDFLTQDKISSLQAENQSLKFAASQANQNSYLNALADAQTAELIRRLGPTPVPAYQVPAPYPYCNNNTSTCGCC